MKKNPGRRDRRRLTKTNRTAYSAKRSAINERKMLWISRGRKDAQHAAAL